LAASGDFAAVSTIPAALAESPDAERRQLTVMFCDLVGSTALATPNFVRAVSCVSLGIGLFSLRTSAIWLVSADDDPMPRIRAALWELSQMDHIRRAEAWRRSPDAFSFICARSGAIRGGEPEIAGADD
jgi:hypothetical protein